MRKVISLYQRNYETDRLVRDEVVPGAEWVLAWEGIATQKLDGTCCMIRDGTLYRRYEVARGKTPPPNFEAASELDPETGKIQGWVPVGEGPEDRYHREAWDDPVLVSMGRPGGTYELVGPKVQGNPEGWRCHALVRHGHIILEDVPRDFEGLRAYFLAHDVEGIVWHRENGEMVKLKRRDYGLKRTGGGT